jgi:quercetin dioxygenase-like cupin family protein
MGESAGRYQTYVVAGGNHVTVLLDRSQSDGQFDVIEVHAAPGGGPPPHRHGFAEWFRVLEGELTITAELDGTMRPVRVLAAAESAFIAPGVYHGTLNLADRTCRFEVIGQPAMMSGYFAEAGVPVADAAEQPANEPPGPEQLREISGRWGIEFWTGPIDSTVPPALAARD